MTSDSAFSCRWNDLPDPRVDGTRDRAVTTIELQETDWRKIVGKHFANPKEPWSDLLSPEVVASLVSRSLGAGSENEVTDKALAAIRDQIEACLQRPLVILYSCIGQQLRGQGRRWLLVFPCGAIAVIWAEPRGNLENRLKTCYFTGAVAVKLGRGDRWKHALRQQVQEYATFNEVTREYVYPRMDDRREVSVTGASAELRYAIQFVAPEAWGFESNAPGAPWQRPSWSWPSQEHAALNLRAENAEHRKGVMS